MKTGLLLLSLPLASAGGKITFGSGEHGSIELRTGGLSFNAAVCVDRSNWCYPYDSTSCATADDATVVTKTTLSIGSEISLYSDHTIRFTSGDGGCVGLDKSVPTDAQLTASTAAKLAQLKFQSGGATQARIHNDNSNKLWVQAATVYEGDSEINAWTPLGSWNTANSKNCLATPTKEFGAERNLHDPDTSAHKESLEECQKLCEDTATCNCVSYSGSSQQCWLRENCILAQCKAESDSNWISATYWSEPAAVVTGSWTANAGKNCFVGTGAERNIEEYTFESSIEQCQERCEATDGCNCVVHDDRGVSSKPCHLRENCIISDCQDEAGWSTYYSGAAITTAPTEAPTESPTEAPTESPTRACTNDCLQHVPCRHNNDCSCVQQVNTNGEFVATGSGTCSAGTTELPPNQLYVQTLAKNCFAGTGAAANLGGDIHGTTYDNCKDHCTNHATCNCFGFQNTGNGYGNCFLRQGCIADECANTWDYGGNDWSINIKP